MVIPHFKGTFGHNLKPLFFGHLRNKVGPNVLISPLCQFVFMINVHGIFFLFFHNLFLYFLHVMLNIENRTSFANPKMLNFKIQ